MTNKQFIGCYHSAGLWFVALYMESFICRYDELQDRDKKRLLISEIYNNGENADSNIGGTNTRVNCLRRIIEARKVVEILGVAVNSDRLKSDYPNAYDTAQDLLQRINTGIFILP